VSIAVITFPGSNCDRDCLHVLQNVVGAPARMVFHKETELGECSGVLVPGGFSYGDYLRAGALAKIAPIMPAIKRFADAGGPVLGICNGFQILCEGGLLPGALMLNKKLQFISRHIDMRVENSDTLFTRYLWQDQIVRMPIAHAEGNFFADPRKRLRNSPRIAKLYSATSLPNAMMRPKEIPTAARCPSQESSTKRATCSA
jgi:phosphoribosylformylglycinamidine synthase I